MGWKTLKEKYKIEHNIGITSKGLCIGSGYVHDLVVVNLTTGEVKENSTFSNFLTENYPELKTAKKEEVLAALKAKDTFVKNLPIFSYEGSNIIEDKTEAYDYPNTTHSGKLIHDNTFFKDRESAIKAAKKDNQSAIDYMKKHIDDKLKELNKTKNELIELEKTQEELKKL